MKHIALGLLPALALFAGCSGGNANFDNDGGGADDGGGTDDGGGADDSSPPPPTNAPLATNLAVTGITVNQAVEVNVLKNGAVVGRNAPIVAGRRGVVRVFVTPGSGWTAHAITGVLTLHTAGKDHTFTATLTPKVASTDASFNTTFDFNVDAASFGTDTTYLVQLKDPNGPSPGDDSAQYPNNGTASSLAVQASGAVKIYLYPIHFTSGGSTPATGGVDVNAYTATVMNLYPATAVNITVQPTLNYSGAVPSANGSNWDQLLNAMIQKRAADSTPDVYYYGAFAPASSYASYCSGGCVAGLSSIPSSPSNYSQKASIGLVYGGDSQDQQATGNTMAHEVGHGHGREHSPTSSSVQGCITPNGIDPGYPYANGAIGVWGYNLNSAQPVDPTQYFDIMGYCAYADWISDYTYKALFSWVAADNGADMSVSNTPVTYRMIEVHGDGTIAIGASFPVYGPVSGESHTVTYEDNGVPRSVTGYYYPYDHVAGGYLLAPEPAHFTSVRVADFSKASAVRTGAPMVSLTQ